MTKLHLFELKDGHIVLDGTIIRGIRECKFSIKENDSLAELSLKMDVRILGDKLTAQFYGGLDKTGKTGKRSRNQSWLNFFPRKITVTIAFKPNAERNFVATGVQTKTTLAPALGAVTAFSMGKNLQTGEVEAIEMGNQIPGQMSVNDVPGVVPENVVEVEGKAVDTDTGEIVGTAGSKVVDLRRREA